MWSSAYLCLKNYFLVIISTWQIKCFFISSPLGLKLVLMLAQKMFVKKFKSEQEFKETEMLHKNATR